MAKIWKLYEIPILLVAFINWLVLFVFTESPVYAGFWWIVLFYSTITLLFSRFLDRMSAKPSGFFSWFAVGKAVKFFLSVVLLLILSIIYPDTILNSCITAGALFLVTLVVDTCLLLRFAQNLKKEMV